MPSFSLLFFFLNWFTASIASDEKRRYRKDCKDYTIWNFGICLSVCEIQCKYFMKFSFLHIIFQQINLFISVRSFMHVFCKIFEIYCKYWKSTLKVIMLKMQQKFFCQLILKFHRSMFIMFVQMKHYFLTNHRHKYHHFVKIYQAWVHYQRG